MFDRARLKRKGRPQSQKDIFPFLKLPRGKCGDLMLWFTHPVSTWWLTFLQRITRQDIRFDAQLWWCTTTHYIRIFYAEAAILRNVSNSSSRRMSFPETDTGDRGTHIPSDHAYHLAHLQRHHSRSDDVSPQEATRVFYTIANMPSPSPLLPHLRLYRLFHLPSYPQIDRSTRV